MPAPNIEPRNYTLGRGKVYFARFGPGSTVAADFRYLGNTPEFNLTIESEELDHYNSDEGIREKDESVPLEVNRTGSLTCDDIQSENLALFFFGSTAVVTQAGQTSQSETLSSVYQGVTYQIGVTSSNPVGLMGLENVVVKASPGGTPVYTAGTDYVLHADSGLVEILASGAISDGDDIDVDYDVQASTRTRILSGATPVQGAMKFIQNNPQGSDKVYTFTTVKITPNGDFNLKGDEWQQLPFSFEALKPGDGREAIYLDGTPVYS